MALGELGRLKLRRLIDQRMITLWIKLESENQSKISCKVFQLSKAMYEANIYKPKWVHYVKNLLDKTGFSNMWTHVNDFNSKWLKSSLQLRIDDLAKQDWLSEVHTNSKCVN